MVGANGNISSGYPGSGNSKVVNLIKRIQNSELPLLSKIAVIGVSLLWIFTIIFGYLYMVSIESVPGERADHPQQFPLSSALTASTTGNTLLMFIHPKCPCTSASLNELAVLSTRCGGKLDAIAVFIRPESTPDGWERTDHWLRAQRIPGVKVVSDYFGKEAALFGARTSGEVLLYNRDGELVFSGGITGGRGHEGDNRGLDSVTGIIRANDMRCKVTNTFGCALNGPLP